MGLKRFSCKCSITFASKNIKKQNSRNIISLGQILKKKISPCESTIEEVSFEWQCCMISSTDPKNRTTVACTELLKALQEITGQ